MLGSAFSAVNCRIEKGESIKAESGAMISMSAALDITGSTGDGCIVAGITRKLLAGEDTVEVDTAVQNLTKGFFSGHGGGGLLLFRLGSRKRFQRG